MSYPPSSPPASGLQTMPKCVGRNSLRQPGPSGRLPHRLLNDRFVKVVTMLDAGPAVEVVGRSGEDPLPSPLAVRVGVLAGQGVRQGRPAQALAEIGFLLLAHQPQVVLER